MLLKKIIGSLIIFLNIAGLGFLLYMMSLLLKDKYFSKKKIITDEPSPLVKKKEAKNFNDDIIPDEDDLLKDMDLSDLDNLDLDDFE